MSTEKFKVAQAQSALDSDFVLVNGTAHRRGSVVEADTSIPGVAALVKDGRLLRVAAPAPAPAKPKFGK